MIYIPKLQQISTSSWVLAQSLDILNRFLSEQIDNGRQVDIIYIEFTIALERMDYRIFLNKIGKFGLSYDIIDLVASYLSNRIHTVFYNGFQSFKYVSIEVVPQGYNMGLFPFLIFNNMEFVLLSLILFFKFSDKVACCKQGSLL